VAKITEPEVRRLSVIIDASKYASNKFGKKIFASKF
jgi:hypothetical protein